MKDLISAHIEKYKIYIKALLKWAVTAVIVGVFSGLAGSAFHIGVNVVTGLRVANRELILLLPIIGCVIVYIYKITGTEGKGTNDIISEVQTGEGLKLSLVPAIFVSTILTHLGGGSAGREGAALQMGGTIGFEVGKLFRFDDKDLRTATITGMAAFFSALFGTPMAATVFAMAVISVGILYHAALLPCLIASLTAYEISLKCGIEPMGFDVAAPELSIPMFVRVCVLGALCALVAVLFCRSLHAAERFSRDRLPNPWVRVVCGGLLIIGLSFVFPSGDYNGAGVDVITRAVEGAGAAGASAGEVVPYAFLVKILFTVITIAAGYKGGEIVPCFFIGATFGCAAGPLLGIPSGFAAAIGMVCVFCAAVNCPIASIFLAVELFGSEGMIYFAIACALSYVLSGYNGVYSSQKILYSKIKAQYINVHTNEHHEGEITETERRFN